MTVYFQIRSVQLDRSIKGLKDHFRKNSSSTGVPYSPAIQNKRKDTPTKKPVKRPGESESGIPVQRYLLAWVSDTLLQGFSLLRWPLPAYRAGAGWDFREKHLFSVLKPGQRLQTLFPFLKSSDLFSGHRKEVGRAGWGL